MQGVTCVSLSRQKWEVWTQTDLVHCTFKCHEWNAVQNHNINMANKAIENILECFLMLCSKCFHVPNVTEYKKP